jgi:hypothetical protein
VLGSVVAWLTVRKIASVAPAVHASIIQPCHDPLLVRTSSAG